MIPTPDFAVPYDAPKFAKTIEETTPMALKKGWASLSDHVC